MEHCREDDAELIDRYRRGDHSAFEQLHRAYSPLIRRACRSQRVPTADVDDVEQDVWNSFCRYPPTLQRADGLSSWLWVTTVRACHRGRRQPATVSLDAAPDIPSPETSGPDIHVLREESRLLVGALLSSIPASERQLIELVFRDERPNYQDISATMQRPVGSIGPTRSRILRKLRSRAEGRGVGV
jgi:RNA polymerase sigma factor (sigma-70 family)